MKSVGRTLLLIIAIIIGGMLGYTLLPDFELFRIMIFGVACVILGVVFHQIDKMISKR